MEMRKIISLFENIADVVSDIGLGMETAAQNHTDDGAEAYALYKTFDTLTKAYFDAILFTEAHSDNPELENITIQDFALKTLVEMKNDCTRFQTLVSQQNISLDDACKKDGQYTPEEYAGHDFWMTRNHHGVGFWDGDWDEESAVRLTKIAQIFGEVNIYLGDDEKVYS